MTPAKRTSLTCADQRNFDLLNPRVEDVSFRVICEHLAKANRYCGATPGVVYSVAQHSVHCSQAALATGDRTLAAYLLCHDMHEAYLGDDTTPKKRAFETIMGGFGVLAGSVKDAFAVLTDRIDVVIHTRAGLAWAPPPEMQLAIKKWDAILLATEWRDLMQCPQPYPFEQQPIPDIIEPMEDWREARDMMFDLCCSLLPGGVRG